MGTCYPSLIDMESEANNVIVCSYKNKSNFLPYFSQQHD